MKFFIFIILTPCFALAYYPSMPSNNNLQNEIQDQNYRKFNQLSDWYRASIDGRAYNNSAGGKDFFHGTGHMVNIRAELTPQNYYTLNLRSMFISGSSSYGYSAQSTDDHFLAFSSDYFSSFIPGELNLRAGDLERVTFGNGLMIQDSEANGYSVLWQYNNISISQTSFGTSGLKSPGDLDALEMYYGKKLFGFSYLAWFDEYDSDDYKEGDYENYAYDQEYIFKEDMSKPYVAIFLNNKFFNDFLLSTEIARRNETYAGMLAISSKMKTSDFFVSWNLQYRRYDENFAVGFINDIDHEYVTYDQLEKSFNNAINIFSYGDGVNVKSALLNIEYFISDKFRLYSLNEYTLLTFDNEPASDEEDYSHTDYPTPSHYDKEFDLYFYRLGIAFYPKIETADYLTFFVSNKLIGVTSTAYKSYNNLPLFLEYTYWGVEGVFAF